jgi:hypothetical protein
MMAVAGARRLNPNDFAVFAFNPLSDHPDPMRVLAQIDRRVAPSVRVVPISTIGIERRDRGSRTQRHVAPHQRAATPLRGERGAGRLLDQRDALPGTDRWLSDPPLGVRGDVALHGCRRGIGERVWTVSQRPQRGDGIAVDRGRPLEGSHRRRHARLRVKPRPSRRREHRPLDGGF